MATVSDTAMMNENLDKNLFLETDISLHDHCQNCVIFSIPSLCERYGCAVIECPHECGHRFHSCKTEEHLLLCQLVKTPCINACYGCPLWMLRKDLGRHLSVCPASIVYCNMERNRKPLREYGKTLKGRGGRVNEEQLTGDTDLSDGKLDTGSNDHVALDLALAYSDQCQINNLYQLPRSERKSATNFFNKRYPAVPLLLRPKLEESPKLEKNDQVQIDDHQCLAEDQYLIDDQEPVDCRDPIDDRHPTDDQYAIDEGDSSEDEAAARKQRAMIMSPVARECILCKIDPSSQHLHQLGSMVSNGEGNEASTLLDLQSIELDENANEATAGKTRKRWVVNTSKGKSFYTERGLLIDLSADFLPNHYPKCASYYTIVCDQSVRRDEYGDHFSNIHNDIVDGLDGWAMTRCPLWRHGCGYYATRLEPSGGKRKVTYNHWRDTFAIKFDGDESNHRLDDDHVSEKQLSGDQIADNRLSVSMNGLSSEEQDRLPMSTFSSEECRFLTLPYDILCQVCRLLDSNSLFCLASTCRSLNQYIRYSLLPNRGIVERVWMKTESKTEGGRVKWVQGAKRWRFSKSFEPVRRWQLNTIGRLIDHIQKCPYYEPLVHHEERIPVLAFAKPFTVRPSRRDMYHAVPVEIENNDDQVQVFDL